MRLHGFGEPEGPQDAGDAFTMAKGFYLQFNKGRWYAEIRRTTVDEAGNKKVVRQLKSLGVKGRSQRAAAQRALNTLHLKYAVATANRRHSESYNPGINVGEYLSRYLADIAPTIAPTTLRTYTLWVSRFALRFGAMEMVDMTPDHIESWKRDLRANYAPATVNTALKDLHAAFARALKFDIISKDPFRGVRMERMVRDSEFAPYWTDEQFREFMSTVTNRRFRLSFMLAFYAGLRVGEVAALRWEDVNGSYLLVTSHEGHRTKTGHTRKIPIRPELDAELSTWERGSGAVLRSRLRWPDPTNLSKAFTKCQRRFFELCPETTAPKITFHGLRHSFASNLAPHVELPILMKLLGHTNINTTLIYTHVKSDAALLIASKVMRG